MSDEPGYDPEMYDSEISDPSSDLYSRDEEDAYSDASLKNGENQGPSGASNHLRNSFRQIISGIDVNTPGDAVAESSNNESAIQKLADTISTWKRDLGTPKLVPRHLAFVLENTPLDVEHRDWHSIELKDGFGLNDLAEADQITTRVLQNACELAWCSLFISTFRSKMLINSWQRNEFAYSLGRIQDFSGCYLLSGTASSPETVVSMNASDNHVDNKPSSDMRLVLLIVPDIEIYLYPHLNQLFRIHELISYLRSTFEHRQPIDGTDSLWHRICSQIIGHEMNRVSFMGYRSNDARFCENLVPITELCFLAKKDDLLQRALHGIQGSSSMVYTTLLRRIPTISYHLIKDGLDIAIKREQSLQKRFEILRSLMTDGLIENEFDPSKWLIVEKHCLMIMRNRLNFDIGGWLMIRMKEMLSPQQVLQPSAFKQLMDYITIRGGETYFMQSILPIVIQGATHASEAIKFLFQLQQPSSPLTPETAIIVFQRLVPHTAYHFQLPQWARGKTTAFHPNMELNGPILVEFIRICLGRNLTIDAHIIIKKTIETSKGFCRDDVISKAFPFIRDVAHVLSKYDAAHLATRETQRLFSSAFDTYVRRCVGKEPECPQKSRPGIVCERQTMCRHCSSVDTFLSSSDIHSDLFQVPFDDFRHMSTRIAQLEKADCEVRLSNGLYVKYIRITKTWTIYNHEMNVRCDRKKHAKKELGKFSQGTLKRLLGEDFEEITRLACIRQQPQNSPNIPSFRPALAESGTKANISAVSAAKASSPQQGKMPAEAVAVGSEENQTITSSAVPMRHATPGQQDTIRSALKRKSDSTEAVCCTSQQDPKRLRQ